MAHYVLIETADGELEDLLTYCSDSCAKTSELYAGWNGCHELEFDSLCDNCGELITGVNRNEHFTY